MNGQDPGMLGAVEAVERSRTRAHELSWSLRATNLAAAEVDRALAAHLELRSLDYDAMGHIMASEHDPIGTVELAARLGISAGSATELVDRLERAGHVARERSGTDRRRVRVVAQPDAVRRVLGELEPLFGSLDALAEEFTDGERRVIDRYLRAASERLLAYGASLETQQARQTDPGI